MNQTLVYSETTAMVLIVAVDIYVEIAPSTLVIAGLFADSYTGAMRVLCAL